jgi:hypothetical protein
MMSLRFAVSNDMKLKIINIYYFPFLGAPLFGALIYKIQLFLLQRNATTAVWISNKKTEERTKLLNTTKEVADVIFLSAWQLGYQLVELKKSYVLSYIGKQLNKLSSKSIHDLRWAVHFAESITSETEQKIEPLVKDVTNVWKCYAVCVRDDFDVQCDFVRQTIQQLLRRNIQVVALSTRKQSITKEFFGQISVIHIPEHVTFSVPFKVKKVLELFLNFYQKLKIRSLLTTHHSNLVWCFDPEDYIYVKNMSLNTTILYDCVDFLTSEDPNVKNTLMNLHEKLLQRANIVTVNSNTLGESISESRPDAYLVPQGFDLEVFKRAENSVKKIKSSSKRNNFFKDILQTKKPIVTYIGSLSFRLDYQLLIQVIKSRPNYVFCLPKKILRWESEDTSVSWKYHIKELEAFPNIIWYPELNREDVFKLLKKSVAGIIPYSLNFDLNRYCFPMKFFEYLYVGLPILSTPIEELKFYKKFVSLHSSAKGWSDSLDKFVSLRNESSNKNVSLLYESHSWKSKIDKIETIIKEYDNKEVLRRVLELKVKNYFLNNSFIKSLAQQVHDMNVTLYIFGGIIRALHTDTSTTDIDIKLIGEDPDNQIQKVFNILKKRNKNVQLHYYDNLPVIIFFEDGKKYDISFLNKHDFLYRRLYVQFTIGGIFYDPLRRKLFDFYDGIVDLYNQRIATYRHAKMDFIDNEETILRVLVLILSGYSVSEEVLKFISSSQEKLSLLLEDVLKKKSKKNLKTKTIVNLIKKGLVTNNRIQ